ncbi:hypothetical protein B0J13DRAFT_534701 [Dactylonectria estremocensis]|uniref:Uncharacterized protein n=1 Tax=Dactylonectria estremocensis TaxID=1079267 RepID=A0A9P9I6M4_9HYPO|nr:hypothetical protein B0J13DRAFT_534701 [Dactylonectria estremocensis]
MRLSNCLILGLLLEIGLGQSLIEVGIRKWARAIPANTSVVPSTTKSTGETQGSGTRSTTLSGASSSPTGPSVEVDLGGAKLGDHSKFTDDYGKRAIQMSPPPNAEANFTIDVQTPPEISTDELAKIIADINCGGENTGPRLQMFVNDRSVFDKDLVPTNGKFQQVTSDNFKSESDLRIKMVQTNGDESIELIIKDVKIQAVFSSTRTNSADIGTGTGGSSSGSGSGSGFGSGSGSAAPTGTGAAAPSGAGSAVPTGTGSAAPTGSDSAAGRYDFSKEEPSAFALIWGVQ